MLYTGPGMYFVTMVARERRKIFLGVIKRTIEAELEGLPAHYPGWQVRYHVVMADHMHAVFGARSAGIPLGKVVGGFKSIIYRRLRAECGCKLSPWQPNYYEHIIRSEDELKKIVLYIQANQGREMIEWDRVDSYQV